ncbi:hypothetical protein K458DRAFT_392557 [Lentithecium fluviatile CBS 122367]|uniref:Uncharacterized protein n=1 Tax=Lentithecium fluviatile CBS 122367 TaxID=1168545 RepID=A0A6G1ISF5_9PLEO|nr:hypothetical protein K458DRAFT_392557 [Lentithecium fluviatile CBS 122367]
MHSPHIPGQTYNQRSHRLPTLSSLSLQTHGDPPTFDRRSDMPHPLSNWIPAVYLGMVCAALPVYGFLRYSKWDEDGERYHQERVKGMRELNNTKGRRRVEGGRERNGETERREKK